MIEMDYSLEGQEVETIYGDIVEVVSVGEESYYLSNGKYYSRWQFELF